MLRGNSQLNIVFSFWPLGGVASFTENYFCASLCAPSPLLPSCFWHGLDPGRHRPRLPLAHLPRGGTAVVRHNIISVAEREGKACVAVLPSVYAPRGFKHRAPVQRTSIFMIKTCKSCPPPPSFYCQGMKRDHTETLWQSGHTQSKWGVDVGYSDPTAGQLTPLCRPSYRYATMTDFW